MKAVDAVDLEIAEGEFFAMLGPSGSGKTTCLRLIAGFEQPTAGHIEIFGETAEGVPPYRRNVNTVFQDYALFPHMNVLDNVAYGLMVRRVSASANAPERPKRRSHWSSSPAMARAGPSQLSGGQRQRVALARALVNKPKVLLLDEPLGALDLKLREQMQEELKALQKALGITFIFVTHDQGEALSMADRVAVFNDGRIMQIGTPQDIYRAPAHALRRRFRRLVQCAAAGLRRSSVAGRTRWASLRPEAIRIVAAERRMRRPCSPPQLSRRPDAVSLQARRADAHRAASPSGGTTCRRKATDPLAWQPDDLHLMEDEA